MKHRSDLSKAGVSPREAEVLNLLGQHLTHAEIGERLFISVRTVESHAASLRRKLGLVDRRELMRFAAQHRTDSLAPEQPLQPSRLPTPLTSLVGRDKERKELSEAIIEARLVTAVGPGGVGKTRLAIAASEDVAHRVEENVFYVDLVPVSDPMMLLPTVLTALGLTANTGGSPESILQSALADKQALLVIDNAEHLVNDVAVLVERTLMSCPRLTVLITSRTRLSVPFERVYRVPGLPLGDPQCSEQGDAEQLFVERASAMGHPLTTESDQGRVHSMCDALDGVPLAIELAAARLPSLGWDGLESGLIDRIDVLKGGSRSQTRHRSLRDTLDWSYRLMDPIDQAVLRRVSVFAAEFNAEAAADVVGYGPVAPPEVTESLGRLVDSSLLAADTSIDSETRYRALETIRQYGRVQLDVVDDHEVLERHLGWCLDVSRDLNDAESSSSEAWRARFDAVADELRAALGWAVNQAEHQTQSQELATTLGRLLFLRGRTGEAQRRYEEAAVLANEPMTASISYGRAGALAQCRVLGEEALRLLTAAAEAADQAGDRASSALAWARAARHVNRFTGMFAEPPAEAVAETLLSRARSRAPGHLGVRAAVLTATAYAGRRQLQFDQDLIERAVELARQVGDPLLESSALGALILDQISRGEIVTAARTAHRWVDLLSPLVSEPEAAIEIRNALHVAVYTNVAAGALDNAHRFADDNARLPFIREEPLLADEELLAPDALAGRWDRVLSTSKQFREGWERGGRLAAPGRGLGPGAVAMVHGLRGDNQERERWLTMLAAIRGVEQEKATLGSGYGEVFDGIVLLHRGHHGRAHVLLKTSRGGSQNWHVPLFVQWRTALEVESAVLAGASGAEDLISSAELVMAGNPIAAAIVERARALHTGERSTLSATASAFANAGCAYQMARTLVLAGGDERRRGLEILTDMGASPMSERIL